MTGIPNAELSNEPCAHGSHMLWWLWNVDYGIKKNPKINQCGPTKRYLKDINVYVVTLHINIVINNNDENNDEVVLFEFHFVISN